MDLDAASWLFFALCTALVITLLAWSELAHKALSRLLTAREDPRPLGLFRLVFGLLFVGNILSFAPVLLDLFSSQGLLPTEVARSMASPSQFGSPPQFENGVWLASASEPSWQQYLQGPEYSLLFIWDSPAVVYIHYAALLIAGLCLAAGLFTRVSKWLAYLLFLSFVNRDPISMGGSQVFANFLFWLCFSRCEAAYSVDRWLRARGSSKPYALVPMWPRIAILVQVAVIYGMNGFHKSGETWQQGDALYYTLNLDNFYRFDPGVISALFGTNLFRVMTWTTKWWEHLFPLVLLGLLWRAFGRERPQNPRCSHKPI